MNKYVDGYEQYLIIRSFIALSFNDYFKFNIHSNVLFVKFVMLLVSLTINFNETFRKFLLLAFFWEEKSKIR